jgi:hypothetical protein
MREDNYPRPVSDPAAEGLPEYADDDSIAEEPPESGREADGPDPAALPSDTPLAVDRFGTTPEEARQGEPLSYKLWQEAPDEKVADDPEPGTGEGQPGDNVDLLDDEIDLPDEDLDPGRPVGRLVEPDEGAHPDEEKDAIARDAGTSGGGASAEELAMHEVPEP